MKAPRIIVYGLGSVGQRAARIAHQKGAEVVAAYMRSTQGKDVSAPELARARICTPDVPFRDHGADVLIMTHASQVRDIHAVALQAAKAGLDVVSVSNEAYDPFMPAEELGLMQEIDAAFRAAGKSFLACGVQDSFWYCQPLGLSLAAGRISAVTGECTADMGLFGPAATTKVPIGLTAEEFQARGHAIPKGNGIFEVAMRPLIRSLGLVEKGLQREVRPHLSDRDLLLKSGQTIPAGTTRGYVDSTVFATREGIKLTGNFYVTFLYPEETATNQWVIDGDPKINMLTQNFPGDDITAAVVVNRITDVVAARAGVLCVDELPEGRYRHSLLAE